MHQSRVSPPIEALEMIEEVPKNPGDRYRSGLEVTVSKLNTGLLYTFIKKQLG